MLFGNMLDLDTGIFDKFPSRSASDKPLSDDSQCDYDLYCNSIGPKYNAKSLKSHGCKSIYYKRA